MRTLRHAGYVRDPESPYLDFDWYVLHVAESSDPAAAETLIASGRQAVQSRDPKALQQINRRLDELFPGTSEERRLSFGSGVR